RRTPGAVAVACEERRLTYRELEERSSEIARGLRALGLGRGSLVGVCLERSLDMVVGLLAILKTGAAYVPLDPDYPEHRLACMIRDSGAACVLAGEDMAGRLARLSPAAVRIGSLADVRGEAARATYSQPQAQPSSPLQVAYVIYTSGSTGEPKGVMVSHRALVNCLASMSRVPGLHAHDRLLAVTTCAFDIAALELFLPLVVGAQTIVCPASVARDGHALAREIERCRPSVMQATPATWTMLVQAGWENRERVRILCGGEALPEALKDHFVRTSSEAWNVFGPTETTIWSTVSRLAAGTPTTIGRPIANTEIYVLDDRLQPAPIGVPGELYIAGTGLADGYRGKPALTAERFVAHPFRAGAVLYRTGDLARWRVTGEVEYLGRTDQQVKIRGFRVEPGEIEARLRAHPAIADAVVITRTANAATQLVAYCEAREDRFDAREVREVLARDLPGYMVPAAFVRVERIPRTANSKVDRAALLRLPVEAPRRTAPAGAESDAEGDMLAIWEQVLNRHDIGVEDGFFDAGGDSILATALVDRISRELRIPVDATAVFRYPTVRAMARFVVGKRDEGALDARASGPSPAPALRRGDYAAPDYYDESLAIVGMSCHVPGATNPQEFWEALRSGRESLRAGSAEDLRAAGLPCDLGDAPGYVAIHSSIDEKDGFDPEFFGMTARDAAWMDFQFRLLLMHSWKACEDAGYRPGQLAGCAVFMSASNSFYHAAAARFPADGHGVLRDAGEYVAWVLAQGGSISTMISHKLGLSGASAFVHSNCSSSLVALQLAHQAIRVGDSESALVGAATIFPSRNLGYCHRPGLNFSSDGHVRTFDHRADGTVPAEGVAVILVKRASAAVRDGDHIYCLVRGVAVNNDGGATVGFYAPSVSGQSAVIRRALQQTGVDPESIQYVEAHGTGTALGDPVELAALSEAYREHTSRREFCGIGSVKSNIGHLDTAAGLAGVIKVALSLKHGEIPPTINYTHASPHLDLQTSPFFVVDRLLPWPTTSGMARAAVSAFGLGGTNAHAILEKACARPDPAPGTGVDREDDRTIARNLSRLVPLSARTREALTARARALRAALSHGATEGIRLEDLAYTLQAGRVPMAERLMFVVESVSDLVERLTAYLAPAASPEAVRQPAAGGTAATCDRSSSQVRDALRRGDLDVVVHAWLAGAVVDWEAFYTAPRPRRVSLPTYAFAMERYRLLPATPEPAPDTRAGEPAAAQPAVALFTPGWEVWPGAIGAGNAPDARRTLVLCAAPALSSSIERALAERAVACVNLRSSHDRIDGRFVDYASGVFRHVREILRASPEAPVTYQVVVPVQHEEVALAGLAALLRSAARENPRLVGQLLRLSDTTTAADVVRTLDAMHRSGECLDLWHAGGRVMQLAWTELISGSHAAVPWQDDAVYLVTGGAGALGTLVVGEIGRHVRRATAILVGRSPLAHVPASVRQEWQRSRVHVRYVSADVTQSEHMTALVANLLDELGRIDGVLHVAGVVHDNYVINKSVAELERVLAPKVAGLVNLDLATRSLPLDLFAMFSSLAGVVGTAGQSDYAAANRFMDGYAEHRARLVASGERHGVTLSVQWPFWVDGGMAVHPVEQDVLERRTGLVPLTTERAFEALYRSIESRASQVLVMSGDIERVRDLISAAALPEGIAAPGPVAAGDVRDAAAGPPADPDALQEDVEVKLRQLFSAVSQYDADRIDGAASLDRYGLDSIRITELNQRLEAHFPGLPATLFFERRTLRDVGKYLLAAYAAESARWLGRDVPKRPPPRTVRAGILPGDDARVRPGPSPAHAGADEPIAIIGLAGRYPMARTIEELWDHLKHGRDCVTEIPEDRWPLDGFFLADKHAAVSAGMSYSKWGGFIPGFAEFDPLFFNISPRDAVTMDPQERLFIQCCWEVVEDAGYTRERLARTCDSNVGVFVGITKTGYELYGPDLWRQGVALHPYTSFGSVANRVSFLLDLNGPSMPIDTMCSASLAAIYVACEHLHRGACAMAIAGGVNLYVHPATYVTLCGQQMLAADGRCRSFGDGGDGFVPGEGVGAVLLKPLSRALADGDHIYALIRAASMNHGGRTHGYTVPNPSAQAALVRRALDLAGTSARAVSYVEAHGTGTALGDPIEIAGLTQAFRHDTDEVGFCRIGSVKSAIGHLEAAAGIAGLTKVVLQLKHRQLVPSLHAEPLNPKIDFSTTPFLVQREITEWARPHVTVNGIRTEAPRIAGVSSFGAGGANAHVILEEFDPDAYGISRRPAAAPATALIPLSARDRGRLLEVARNLHRHLTSSADAREADLASMACTLQTGREPMSARMALAVSSVAMLVERLQAFLSGEKPEDMYVGEAGRDRHPLADALADDGARRALMAQWVAGKKHRQILTAWVNGVDVDWDELYAGDTPAPRRISLPAYPFERTSYWIPQPRAAEGTSTAAPEVCGAGALEGAAPAIAWRDERIAGDIRWNERLARRAHGRVLVVHDDEEDAEALVRLLSEVSGSGGLAAAPVVTAVRAADLLAPGVESADRDASAATVFWLVKEATTGTRERLVSTAGRFADAWREVSRPASVYCVSAGSPAAAHEYYEALTSVLQANAGAGQAWRCIHAGACQTDRSAHQILLHEWLADTGPGGVALVRYDGERRSVATIAAPAARAVSLLEKRWASRSIAASGRPAPQSVVILVNDESARFATELARRGGPAVLVWLADPSAPTMTPDILLDHRSPASGRDAADALLKRLPSIDAIVDLADFHPQPRAFDEDKLGRIAFYQRLIREFKPLSILHVTSGLHRFDCEAMSLAGAKLTGLIKMLDVEYPHVNARTIDVVGPLAGDPARFAEMAWEEIDSDRAESEVCYRAGGRFVPYLEDIPLSDVAGAWWPGVVKAQPEHVYVITGGVSGIGLEIADHLVACGARNLVLMGITPLPPRDAWSRLLEAPDTPDALREKLRRLAAIDRRVESLRIYIGALDDEPALTAFFDRVRGEIGPIRGVIHSAGAYSDPTTPAFVNKAIADIDRVLQPKVAGVESLHRLFAADDLLFFVAFSSLTGVIPSLARGLSDYAMANAYLDAFAAYQRHARGRTHYRTITWVDWNEAGAGARLVAADRARLDRTLGDIGLRTCDNREGRRLFDRAMSIVDRSWVFVSALDRELFAKARGRLLQAAATRAAGETRPSEPPRVPAARAVPSEHVIAHVRDTVVEVLQLPQADDSTPMQEYGLDSISAVHLAVRLEKKLQIEIQPAWFVEYPTIDALSRHLAARVPQPRGRVTAQAPLVCEPAPRTRSPRRAHDLEPIAIVGLAGFFPRCRSVQAFWKALDDGVSLIEEIPASRFEWRDVYDPAGRDRSKSATKWGGFIPDVAHFDAGFFNILPIEAERMDPRQRLLLMSVYHCLEDAGVSPESLRGTRTGLFVGAEENEYLLNCLDQGLDDSDGFGRAASMLANRVSYAFDFHGPSEVVNTMCSSAAVALHRAVAALRSGEIDRAIVGAANVILRPDGFITLSRLQQMSPVDTVCSFGVTPRGHLRAESVASVLLEPLSRAEEAGHAVHALIRNTAVSYNGRGGMSIAAPNASSHARLIEACWAGAGIDPRELTYVEAQGMGNEIADLTEWTAINRALVELGQERGAAIAPGRCRISTLKPMTGHMESASALGALAKIVYSLRAGRIFPILGHTGESFLETEGQPARFATHTEVWAPGDAPRLAGLHSFSAGGNNAHVLIEEYSPPPTRNARRTDDPTTAVAPISARSPEACRTIAANLLDHLRAQPEIDLHSAARTLQVGRDAMPHRVAIVAQSRADLVRFLETYVSGAAADRIVEGTAPARGTAVDPPVQWHGSAGVAESIEVARRWCRGSRLEWESAGEPVASIVHVPGYPFSTAPYWIQPASAAARVPGSDSANVRAGRAGEDDEAVRSLAAESVVRNTLGPYLHVQPHEVVLDAEFRDLGFDSILVMQLAAALERDHGIRVEPAAFFEITTPQQLAEVVASSLAQRAESSDGPLLARGDSDVPARALVASARQAPPRPAQPRPAEPVITREPVAIIGLAGVYPEAPDLEAFWTNLEKGADCIREVP
ncbi:MAG: amino acid adenylation domain-containing protein, partial [Vicinamibacterales bacterium]